MTARRFADDEASSAVGESAESWERSMSINCLAHVWAAESVVPEFESREEGGSFVTVASAAGLLTQVGAPSYSVSKAAAVAFAASLAVVRRSFEEGRASSSRGGVPSPPSTASHRAN